MAKKAAKRPRAVASDNRNTAATMIRLDPSLVEKLDAWAKRLSDAGPPAWTRADVIRASLQRAVSERGEKGEAP